jgi:hypothetical protein
MEKFMKVQVSDIPFLKGEKFSSGLVFPLSKVTPAGDLKDRITFLSRLVNGKRVLHVGCVDHLPLVDEKRRRGLWLHERLDELSSQCVGIDINREGCDYVRGLGFGDIFCFDIIKDPVPTDLSSQSFDYLILGEMIEHADNPVEFLRALRLKFSGFADYLIITTPNVFRFQNMISSLCRRECINSDHRYWFSPYTLAKVLTIAGYEDVEINTVWFDPQIHRLKGLIRSLVGFVFPNMRDCLIAKARMNGGEHAGAANH